MHESYYRFLTEISEDKLLILTDAMGRQDVIEWLNWNDPNGIYRDERSLKELGNILSKDEGVNIMLKQIRENRIT